jgi:hypothetical protein
MFLARVFDWFQDAVEDKNPTDSTLENTNPQRHRKPHWHQRHQSAQLVEGHELMFVEVEVQ